MSTDTKHYRFINSQTGNTIYYFTLDGSQSDEEVQRQLEKIKAQVASDNGLFLNTVFWEEEEQD